MRTLAAKLFCKMAHGDQKRKYTGDPYYTHPFAVAEIIFWHTDHSRSSDVYIAALLHDVLEDTNAKPWMIRALFGKRVLDLVLQVTDVSISPDENGYSPDGNRKARKQKDLEHLAKADADGQTIKLADLIHNSSTVTKYDPDFAKVYMKEKERLLRVLTKGNNELWIKAKKMIENYKEFGY